MQIQANIVSDSLSPQGHRLTTMLVTFPRFILAELNTHRMLSKNSASSRAIPFNRMLEMVRSNPFIPIAFQKEHKGMQGTEYITDKDQLDECWAACKDASEDAIENAERYTKIGITKQLANRLLEPFMWHTVLLSFTEIENFFELRCPQYDMSEVDEGATNYKFRSKKDVGKALYGGRTDDYTNLQWLQLNKGQAEIHMMALAEAMWDAYQESIPKKLKPGDWHIPYEDKIDAGEMIGISDYESIMIQKIKISTAMAARTSYTIVGDEKGVSYEKLIGIHDKMAVAKPFHASPFEHCARAMSQDEYDRHIKGVAEWEEAGGGFSQLHIGAETHGWCRNYRGFIQYRHILEEKSKL